MTNPAPAPAESPRVAYTKVMLIVEENRTYGEIIGSPDAPFVTALARSHGTVARMTAGRLPALSFVTPNACHDMHGAPTCPGGVVTRQPHDHCSTLRTMQELLRLGLLGCARSARTMTADFTLAP